ncbi:hypothetical protein DICPUDRAFT_158944 [Dictyostelium purpureum]|uniref:26S proteasome non-ATPase regulatory subunit 5 n=1 Tax=Dictyostelium purpureum TaxID=5786 RepID=F1A2W4_DICPU|nr:uncharacterized protein DICPUDRAFT_158944 [Dictyostelium purpureum]EGC29464.1 hypothetical protein DICPUDRAFT_158944 [Dictyostelium purpureum]|eukprot:XP_003294007.1 hypothetical protein DICPUDRAFT_158944 [Dictyostelium purpureum]
MEKIQDIIHELKNANNEDDIIDLCFSIISIISENVNNYRLLIKDEMLTFLKTGLSDQVNPEVTTTTIRLLQLPLKVEPKETLEFIFKNGILEDLLNNLKVSSIGVSQAAKEMFNKIISLHQHNDFIIFSDWFKNKYNDLLNEYSGKEVNGQDKIILFRIIDIGSNLLSFKQIEGSFNIQSESPEALKLYTDKLFEKYKEPFISRIIKIFDDAVENDDFMTQMNIIKSIEEICKFSNGIETLYSKGFFKSISDLLEKSIDSKYQDKLLGSSPLLNKSISFVANVSSKGNDHITVLFKDFNYLNIFRYHLDHCEEFLSKKLKMVIIGSIGIIGMHVKGLDLINRDRELMRTYAEFLASGDQETIVTIYNSFAIMLKSKEKIYTVSDKIYQVYSSIPSDLLLSKLSKNYQSPIEDVKNASLGFIQALSIHSWGADSVIKMAGFFEYLMNRMNETTKTAKEWKFFIVQTLYNNHKDLFSSDPEWRDRYFQMESYIKKGVHFIPYEANIKVENEHL